MRLKATSKLLAFIAGSVLVVSSGAHAADLSLTVSPAVGYEGIAVAGVAPGGGPLDTVLYARFSKDLPSVLLSRRLILVDAGGRFNTTISIAPAFFRDAIVTVIVTSRSTGASARASTSVGAPNLPAPADEFPPATR